MRTFVITFIAVLMTGAARADEQVIKLKQAPGVDKVEGNCAACHTLAHIPMNSPYLKPAQWDAEVNKMIKVMGGTDRRCRRQNHQGLSGKKLRRLNRYFVVSV
jgi:hypothetical protein